MQEAIDKALEWGAQQGLSFSSAKTVAVHLSQGSAHYLLLPASSHGGSINCTCQEQVKYLGLLSWTDD